MKNAALVALIVVASVFGTLYFTKEDVASPDTNTFSDSSDDSNQSASTVSEDAEDYSNKGLTEFPKELLSKTSITEIDISGNSLTGALPGEIRFLSNLEVLDVSDNNMTGIPAEIGQLSKLRVLNYANNSITGLPNEISNLKNLEVFDLRGNNPAEQDLQGIRNALPNLQILL